LWRWLSCSLQCYPCQEWTKEQSEVWKVVQDNWKVWKAKDATAVAASFMKSTRMERRQPYSYGENIRVEWYNSMKDAITVSYYNIEPARIVVLKTSAVVHYFYHMNISWTWEATRDQRSEGKSRGILCQGRREMASPGI